MFRRLRLQFITIASLAILFILVSTVGIINTVRSFQTEQEISKVLNTLTENNGSFGKTKKIETNQGREIPSDSFRFFSVTLSGDEVIRLVKLAKIRSLWSFWTRPLIIILPKPC